MTPEQRAYELAKLLENTTRFEDKVYLIAEAIRKDRAERKATASVASNSICEWQPYTLPPVVVTSSPPVSVY